MIGDMKVWLLIKSRALLAALILLFAASRSAIAEAAHYGHEGHPVPPPQQGPDNLLMQMIDALLYGPNLAALMLVFFLALVVPAISFGTVAAFTLLTSLLGWQGAAFVCLVYHAIYYFGGEPKFE